MTGITESITIAAPREEVFHRATDIASWPERIDGIEKTEILTEGPVGKGTRFTETRIMFKREATETMEIVDWEPPARYVMHAESCGCLYVSQFRFDEKDGGTKVTFEFEGRPLTFFAKIMSFMMKPMLKSMVKLVRKDLENMKASIEGSSEAS